MALKIMVAPVRYVQGPDAVAELGTQLAHFGIRKPLVLMSPSARKAAGATIEETLTEAGSEYVLADFAGESTRAEIERVRLACVDGGHDAIVSCGGGKCIDTGRAAAAGDVLDVDRDLWFPLGAGVHSVSVPTVAANDGAVTSGVVIYNDDHQVESRILCRSNPLLVLVDTAIIAKTPLRLLVSGMGDALSCFFQVDACYRTGTRSIVTHGYATRTGRALARLNLELLLTYGALAKAEVEAGVPGPALEAVCEADILLSGLSFASGGWSPAHAIGMAFDNIRELMHTPQLHGETVAFGTLCQLVLQEADPDLTLEVFGFCRSVGLPTTFEEMTLHDLTDEALEKVAGIAASGGGIKSLPRAHRERDASGYFYDPRELLAAIKATDAYGRQLGHT